MKALRPIIALNVGDVQRAELPDWKPALAWVKPTALLVDEGYQRSLSDRSAKLIARIVANWNWASFKPPVVVEAENGLHVIDGQHTAIAAATHGKIEAIPVFVVKAGATIDRARAFVSHNRDRVVMTPQALHHALVAAGDEDALTIEQVCARAGVKILRLPPWNGGYQPGETSAVGAIRSLVKKRGAMGARRVLEILVAARCAPVSADQIKAVDLLVHDKDYAGAAPERIAAAIMRSGQEMLGEAAQMAAAKSWPRWKALAVVLARKTRARSQTADAA